MEENKSNTNPLDIEIGGDHYKLNGKCTYQPIELAEKLGMYPSCFSILKYVFRHKNKNGKEDLKKALHYCVFLETLCTHGWYVGFRKKDGFITLDREMSFNALAEINKFILANPQLDNNQIRIFLAIANEDIHEVKEWISKEIKECYDK